MDVHCVSMDIHGHPCMAMDMHWYPWISIDICWHPLVSSDFHTFYWKAVAACILSFCGRTWTTPEPWESVRFSQHGRSTLDTCWPSMQSWLCLWRIQQGFNIKYITKSSTSCNSSCKVWGKWRLLGNFWSDGRWYANRFHVPSQISAIGTIETYFREF
jgi:hypothetical protein